MYSKINTNTQANYIHCVKKLIKSYRRI